MLSAFLHTLFSFFGRWISVEVKRTSGSSKACKRHRSVRGSGRHKLKLENILSPAKTPPRFPAPGAIVFVTRAPICHTRLPETVRMFPSPRLYKLSQTPDKGQRDVSPSSSSSLGNWGALHEQIPSRCKYVTSTSDRLGQDRRSRPVCILLVAGMPGADLSIADTP